MAPVVKWRTNAETQVCDSARVASWIPISALLWIRSTSKHCCCTARRIPMDGLLARATNAPVLHGSGKRWEGCEAFAVSGQTRIHLESSARGALRSFLRRYRIAGTASNRKYAVLNLVPNPKPSPRNSTLCSLFHAGNLHGSTKLHARFQRSIR